MAVLDDRNAIVGHFVKDLRDIRPLIWQQPEDVVEGLLTTAVFISDQLRFYWMLFILLIVEYVREGYWIKPTLAL